MTKDEISWRSRQLSFDNKKKMSEVATKFKFDLGIGHTNRNESEWVEASPPQWYDPDFASEGHEFYTRPLEKVRLSAHRGRASMDVKTGVAIPALKTIQPGLQRA